VAVDSAYLEFLEDQLRSWGPIAARRMFSGCALYRGGTHFAFIIRDTLYFRTDGQNRDDYLAAGMSPFTYTRNGRTVSFSYHEVPADVIDDADRLAEWAQKAYAAAMRRGPGPASRKQRRRA